MNEELMILEDELFIDRTEVQDVGEGVYVKDALDLLNDELDRMLVLKRYAR